MKTCENFEALSVAVRDVASDLIEIAVDESSYSGARRLTLERPLPDGSRRYMDLNYVSPDPDKVHSYARFSVLYGVYGHSDGARNFDARQWGDLAHMAYLVREFMVRLADVASLARFVPPVDPRKG